MNWDNRPTLILTLNAKLFQCKWTYIADTPSYCTFFASGWCLIGLAFNTEVHNVVTANSTVVNNNIWNRKIYIMLYNTIKLCVKTYPRPTRQQHSTENKNSSTLNHKYDCIDKINHYLLHFKTFPITFDIWWWRLFYLFLINIHSKSIISHLQNK